MIDAHNTVHGLRTHLGDDCNSYISNLRKIIKMCMKKTFKFVYREKSACLSW